MDLPVRLDEAYFDHIFSPGDVADLPEMEFTDTMHAGAEGVGFMFHLPVRDACGAKDYPAELEDFSTGACRAQQPPAIPGSSTAMHAHDVRRESNKLKQAGAWLISPICSLILLGLIALYRVCVAAPA